MSQRVDLSPDGCFDRARALLLLLHAEERLKDRAIVTVLVMALANVLAQHDPEKLDVAIDFLRATVPDLRAELQRMGVVRPSGARTS